jgi:hypothetical protein
MGHCSTMEWPLHVRFVRTITYPITQVLFVVSIGPSASFTAKYLLEGEFHAADMSKFMTHFNVAPRFCSPVYTTTSMNETIYQETFGKSYDTTFDEINHSV